MLLPSHILWQGKSYKLADFQSFLSLQLAKETLSLWEHHILHFAAQWCNPHIKQFEVHTSGSTGKTKSIRLTRQTMQASAQATAKALHWQEGQSILLCLPADYIAGKMVIVRAIELGLDLYYTQPKANAVSQLKRTYDICALVPLQLQHAIDKNEQNKLNLLRCILLGGDTLPTQYLSNLQNLNNKIFATYGMTETSTHIALRPLNGNKTSVVYQCLEGVEVENNAKGCLRIKAPHLHIEALQTTDMAIIHSPSAFSLLGRADFVINSGGIKIHPEKVEKALSTLISKAFVVTVIPHPQLGKAAVLLVESDQPIAEMDILQQARTILPPYHTPKTVLYTSALARKANGKIDRRACEEQARKLNRK